MTTQRDRLAAVLHDFPCGGNHITPWDLCVRDHVREADALLARGVRVVDVDTLAAAFASGFHHILGTDAAPVAAKMWANAILAALDGEDAP